MQRRTTPRCTTVSLETSHEGRALSQLFMTHNLLRLPASLGQKRVIGVDLCPNRSKQTASPQPPCFRMHLAQASQVACSLGSHRTLCEDSRDALFTPPREAGKSSSCPLCRTPGSAIACKHSLLLVLLGSGAQTPPTPQQIVWPFAWKLHTGTQPCRQ